MIRAHALFDEKGVTNGAFAPIQFFITAVSDIHFRGKDLAIPLTKNGLTGPYTDALKTWIKDIMYGREEHPWGVLVEETGLPPEPETQTLEDFQQFRARL